MKKTNLFRRLAAGLAVGILFAGLMLGNVLYTQDQMFSDMICQQPVPKDGEIVLINIDQASLDALGPFGDWGRALMGDVLAILNEDPQTAPAVVALDVLYVGASDDPEGDAYLAKMAGTGVPVVTACAGTYDTTLVTQEDGSFYMADGLVAFDEPYAALKENSYQGHINSMFDRDGILRHGIWQIELPGGELVPSFHRKIYELYCASKGIAADTVPFCDSRECYYVPFQGNPGDYSDGYGVIDLLDGQIDPSVYAGKIVLIGPYAAGMQDDFTTAVDHATKMYGIEYQANMLDALIHGRTMREVPGPWQALLVFVVSILCGMFFYRRKMLPATLVLAGAVVSYIANCFSAAAAGLVL